MKTVHSGDLKWRRIAGTKTLLRFEDETGTIWRQVQASWKGRDGKKRKRPIYPKAELRVTFKWDLPPLHFRREK